MYQHFFENIHHQQIKAAATINLTLSSGLTRKYTSIRQPFVLTVGVSVKNNEVLT